MFNKKFNAVMLGVLLANSLSFGAWLRVNKKGSDALGTTYKTIQEAVNACTPEVGCDEIVITDETPQVYEEQVTFDNKSGIKLHSLDPKNPATIKFTDKTSVNPTTAAQNTAATMDGFEAARTMYDMNGALRILWSSEIEIYDIKIDGGERFFYSWQGVWGAYPLNGGNVGVMVRNSSKVHVHHTEIFNCWYGIYTKGRNLGGQNANPNKEDKDSEDNLPISAYGIAGRGLFEYNKIYDNSFAFFGESEWDLGSTIRYNLVYNNYARTGETSEGRENGGFLKLKDVTLAVYQIYNNTLWKNYYFIVSDWKAGFQNILFNNIYAKLYKLDDSWDEWYDILDVLPQNSYSVAEYLNKQKMDIGYETQGQFGPDWLPLDEPLPRTYNLAVMSSETSSPFGPTAWPKGGEITVKVGGEDKLFSYSGYTVLGQPIKSINNENWFYDSLAWQSTDPADPNFLCPDWTDPNVQMAILDMGRTDTGLKDADGSAPEIGALSKAADGSCVWGGDAKAPKLTISGTSPLLKSGSKAKLIFVVDVKNADIDQLSNVSFELVEFFEDVPIVEGDDQFPATKWPTAKVIQIDQALKAGTNEITIDLDLGDVDYSNLVVTIKGDIAGQSVTSEAEVFQFRGESTQGGQVKREYNLEIGFVDVNGVPLDSVKAGQPLKMNVSVVDFDGNPAAVPLSTITSVRSSTYKGSKQDPSFWSVVDPYYTDWFAAQKQGNPSYDSPDFPVPNLEVLTAGYVAFSESGYETVCLSGTNNPVTKSIVFGCAGIRVTPGTAWSLALVSPESSKGPDKEGHQAKVGKGATSVQVQLLDIFGNAAANDDVTTVQITSSNQEMAKDPAPAIGADKEGVLSIPLQVLGEVGDIFTITANFVGEGNNGQSDFSNVVIAIPPSAVRLIPVNATGEEDIENGSIPDIKEPSGACVEMKMGLLNQEDDKVSLLAESLEFQITPAPGLTFFTDASCETLITEGQVLKTGEDGRVTLYMTGKDLVHEVAGFSTKLSTNLLVQYKHESRIEFFSPEIFFLSPTSVADGAWSLLTPEEETAITTKENFMYIGFEMQVGAYFEGAACTSCQNFFDVQVGKTINGVPTILTGDDAPIVVNNAAGVSSEKIKLNNGFATISIVGQEILEAKDDAFVIIKVGNKADTLKPILMKEPPVPYVEEALMYDNNGDGIADLLTLAYHRPFVADAKRDSLPEKFTLRWSADKEEDFLEFVNTDYVNAGDQFVTFRADGNSFSHPETGQFAAGVNTTGPGQLFTHWRVVNDTSIVDGDKLESKVQDRIGPVVVSASLGEVPLFNVLTVEFSEEIDIKKADGTAEVLEYSRYGERVLFLPSQNGGVEWNTIVAKVTDTGDTIRHTTLDLRFDKKDTLQPNLGDSVRVRFAQGLEGMIVDKLGNLPHENSIFVEITGQGIERVDTKQFHEAAVPELTPEQLDSLYSNGIGIATVRPSLTADDLASDEHFGVQGLLVPFTIFHNVNEEGLDPADITAHVSFNIFTSLGGFVNGYNFEISCIDEKIWGKGMNCLSTRQSLYFPWYYRDFNGRKVGTGVYVYVYEYRTDVVGKSGIKAREVIEQTGFRRKANK